MRLPTVLLCGALLCGCPHTQQRAENAATSAGYQAELEKCLSEADVLFKAHHDQHEAMTAYMTCADAADAKYGVKK